MRKVNWLTWGVLLVMGGCAMTPMFLPDSLNYREASNGERVWWQHVTAYEQGLEAGRFGVPTEANPYQSGDGGIFGGNLAQGRAAAWLRGWMDGKKEKP